MPIIIKSPRMRSLRLLHTKIKINQGGIIVEVFRKKKVSTLIHESQQEGKSFKKTMGSLSLTALGVGEAGVIVLRKKLPELERPFRVPWMPILPALSILFSIYLMFNLPGITWLRFFVWIVVGLIIYFAYSYRHSQLRTKM
jgi:hypothetical protein